MGWLRLLCGLFRRKCQAVDHLELSISNPHVTWGGDWGVLQQWFSWGRQTSVPLLSHVTSPHHWRLPEGRPSKGSGPRKVNHITSQKGTPFKVRMLKEAPAQTPPTPPHPALRVCLPQATLSPGHLMGPYTTPSGYKDGLAG